MLKDITSKQIEIIKEHEQYFNPKQQAFIKSLEAFLATQNMLDKSDLNDLIERSRKAGALDFAELLSEINQSQGTTVAIPVRKTEKSFNAREFADFCGVSVQLVRRECEKGNIPAKRGVKNSWIISEKELKNPLSQRWLENKRTMWKEIREAKEELKESPEFINGLKEIENSRKHGVNL